MRKKLFIACIALFMAFPFQSFKPSPVAKPLPSIKALLNTVGDLKKKFTTRNLYQQATSSGSVLLQIEIQVEHLVGTIYSIRIFDDSNCDEYNYVGYTGSITYSVGNYVASSLDIDLGSGDHVVLNGSIPIGFAPCNGI